LYDKQTQLEEGLMAGVDQLVLHHLSALAATLENKIQMKVNPSLGPLLAERATMQPELMTNKARLSTMENQLSSSLPGATFQGEWLMLVDFFARYTSTHSSTIGDKIFTALASSAGAAGGDLLGNQPCSHGIAVGALQKEMKDICDRLVSTCVTMVNLVFPSLEFTTKCTTLELPQNPGAALIYVEAVTFFHIIGAGFAALSLGLDSSFQTSLHQVLGSNNLVGRKDTGVLLPCAKIYSEWYSDSEGIVSGVKPLIEEGLKTQISFYQGAIE
jgi:hypothetical protein